MHLCAKILIAAAFLKKYTERHKRNPLELTQLHKEELLRYSWPGNVKELQNVIERAVITSQGGKFQLSLNQMQEHTNQKVAPDPKRIHTNHELLQLEIENLKLSLQKTKGKVFGEDGAAKLVGIRQQPSNQN